MTDDNAAGDAGGVASRCPDKSEDRFGDRRAGGDAGGGVLARVEAGLFPHPGNGIRDRVNLAHDPATPAKVDAENLQARLLHGLIGRESSEQTAKLLDISRVSRVGVILPAVDVSHEQNRATGITNRLHRLAQLIAIPEIALLIELDESQAIDISRRAGAGGSDRGLPRRFAQVIGLVRRAPGQKACQDAADEKTMSPNEYERLHRVLALPRV